MSADTDTMISQHNPDIPNIEVDIAMHPTNICWIVAAANQMDPHSPDPFGPIGICYTNDKGATWKNSTVQSPDYPEDSHQLHPSLAWTSKPDRAWLITLANSNPNFTTSNLRCYYSDATTTNMAGATWIRDDNFGEDPVLVNPAPIQSPRIYVDQTSQGMGTIYVIWGSGNSVFVKSRDPQSNIWRNAIQLDSQSTGIVTGCDIKTANVQGLNSIAAVWHDSGRPKLIHQYIKQCGSKWKPAVRGHIRYNINDW